PPPAVRTRAELALLPVIAALIVMPPAALRVSVVAVVQVTAALSAMLPASAPVEPVVTVTLVPALSAVWMSPLLTLAPVAVEGKVSGPTPVAALPTVGDVLIVVFHGSSSQVPAAPSGAEALTRAVSPTE